MATSAASAPPTSRRSSPPTRRSSAEALPQAEAAAGAQPGAAAACRAPSRSRRRRRCAGVLPQRLGLDFAHARLDRSAHPFSGGTPTDVRITTRYDEADFTQAVLARAARDRPRAVRARPADAHAAPAGRRGGRHGGARKPVADRRDAGLPVRRLPGLAGAGAARGLRRRSGAVSRRKTWRGSGGGSSAASSASMPTR